MKRLKNQYDVERWLTVGEWSSLLGRPEGAEHLVDIGKRGGGAVQGVACCRLARRHLQRSAAKRGEREEEEEESTEKPRRDVHCCKSSLGLLLDPDGQRTMCVAGLGTGTIGNDRAVGKTSLKVGAVPLGESPLLGDDDQLTAGELEGVSKG